MLVLCLFKFLEQTSDLNFYNSNALKTITKVSFFDKVVYTFNLTACDCTAGQQVISSTKQQGFVDIE